MKKERNLVVITQSICGIDIKLETLIKKVDTWKVSHKRNSVLFGIYEEFSIYWDLREFIRTYA